MKQSLILLTALLASCGAYATTTINGSVESKCIITTDTDGVYGNPTGDVLSTEPTDGGVTPIIRYDIITADAYVAKISHPDTFSSSPELADTVTWTGDTEAGQMSDALMSAFNTGKVEYNNTTEFDLSVAGSVWFEVTSEADYGYEKAFPAGNYSAVVTAECVAQ
jgi:hypothetical protein|tara:strand:+ start:698 stop:1192 length:495 start_codon:yes stop_codon:yes gene_type:complete